MISHLGQPAMQAFLRTLNLGDEVDVTDVTFIAAVALSVEPAAR